MIVYFRLVSLKMEFSMSMMHNSITIYRILRWLIDEGAQRSESELAGIQYLIVEMSRKGFLPNPFIMFVMINFVA